MIRVALICRAITRRLSSRKREGMHFSVNKPVYVPLTTEFSGALGRAYDGNLTLFASGSSTSSSPIVNEILDLIRGNTLQSQSSADSTVLRQVTAELSSHECRLHPRDTVAVIIFSLMALDRGLCSSDATGRLVEAALQRVHAYFNSNEASILCRALSDLAAALPYPHNPAVVSSSHRLLEGIAAFLSSMGERNSFRWHPCYMNSVLDSFVTSTGGFAPSFATVANRAADEIVRRVVAVREQRRALKDDFGMQQRAVRIGGMALGTIIQSQQEPLQSSAIPGPGCVSSFALPTESVTCALESPDKCPEVAHDTLTEKDSDGVDEYEDEWWVESDTDRANLTSPDSAASAPHMLSTATAAPTTLANAPSAAIPVSAQSNLFARAAAVDLPPPHHDPQSLGQQRFTPSLSLAEMVRALRARNDDSQVAGGLLPRISRLARLAASAAALGVPGTHAIFDILTHSTVSAAREMEQHHTQQQHLHSNNNSPPPVSRTAKSPSHAASTNRGGVKSLSIEVVSYTAWALALARGGGLQTRPPTDAAVGSSAESLKQVFLAFSSVLNRLPQIHVAPSQWIPATSDISSTSSTHRPLVAAAKMPALRVGLSAFTAAPTEFLVRLLWAYARVGVWSSNAYLLARIVAVLDKRLIAQLKLRPARTLAVPAAVKTAAVVACPAMLSHVNADGVVVSTATMPVAVPAAAVGCEPLSSPLQSSVPDLLVTPASADVSSPYHISAVDICRLAWSLGESGSDLHKDRDTPPRLFSAMQDAIINDLVTLAAYDIAGAAVTSPAPADPSIDAAASIIRDELWSLGHNSSLSWGQISSTQMASAADGDCSSENSRISTPVVKTDTSEAVTSASVMSPGHIAMLVFGLAKCKAGAYELFELLADRISAASADRSLSCTPSANIAERTPSTTHISSMVASLQTAPCLTLPLGHSLFDLRLWSLSDVSMLACAFAEAGITHASLFDDIARCCPVDSPHPTADGRAVYTTLNNATGVSLAANGKPPIRVEPRASVTLSQPAAMSFDLPRLSSNSFIRDTTALLYAFALTGELHTHSHFVSGRISALSAFMRGDTSVGLSPTDSKYIAFVDAAVTVHNTWIYRAGLQKSALKQRQQQQQRIVKPCHAHSQTSPLRHPVHPPAASRLSGVPLSMHEMMLQKNQLAFALRVKHSLRQLVQPPLKTPPLRGVSETPAVEHTIAAPPPDSSTHLPPHIEGDPVLRLSRATFVVGRSSRIPAFPTVPVSLRWQPRDEEPANPALTSTPIQPTPPVPPRPAFQGFRPAVQLAVEIDGPSDFLPLPCSGATMGAFEHLLIRRPSNPMPADETNHHCSRLGPWGVLEASPAAPLSHPPRAYSLLTRLRHDVLATAGWLVAHVSQHSISDVVAAANARHVGMVGSVCRTDQFDCAVLFELRRQVGLRMTR